MKNVHCSCRRGLKVAGVPMFGVKLEYLKQNTEWRLRQRGVTFVVQDAKHQVQLFPRGSRSRSRSRASESSGDIVRDSGATSRTDFRDADGGLRSSTVHNEGVRDAHLSPGGARQDMAAPLPHVALPLQCCQTVGVVTGATALPGGAGPGDVVRADGSRGDEIHAAVGSPLGDVLSADARHPRPSVDLRHDLVAPDEVRPPVQSDAWGELGGPSVPVKSAWTEMGYVMTGWSVDVSFILQIRYVVLSLLVMFALQFVLMRRLNLVNLQSPLLAMSHERRELEDRKDCSQ